MGEWFDMDEEEEWVTFFNKNEKEDSFLANLERVFLEFPKKKKKKSYEDELESLYNVAVYQVLPYPPNTKDVKDSFVQRT